MNKIKKIVCMILTAMIIGGTLISCNNNEVNNKVSNYVENGKQALNNNDYANAKVNFEKALNEDLNNKEVLNLCNIIKNYKEAQKYYDNGELEKANKCMSEIPSEYKEYAIKSDVDKLIVNIKEKEEGIVNINTKIKEAYLLIEDKKYEQAKGKLKDIDLKYATEEQKKRIKDNINFADKEDAKVKEQIQKAEEKKKQEELKVEKEKKKQEQIKALQEAKKKVQANSVAKQKEQDENQVKDHSNNTNKANGEPCVYIAQCGVKVVMPASWRDKYYTEEGELGVSVYLRIKGKPLGHPVEIFSIKNGTDTTALYDAKVLNIKGHQYAMGVTKGYFYGIGDASKIDYDTYKEMKHEYGKIKVLPAK